MDYLVPYSSSGDPLKPMPGAQHLKNHLPGTFNSLRNLNQRVRSPDQGLRNLDQRVRNLDQGLRNQDQRVRNQDQGLRNLDQGLQNANQGLRSSFRCSLNYTFLLLCLGWQSRTKGRHIAAHLLKKNFSFYRSRQFIRS